MLFNYYIILRTFLKTQNKLKHLVLLEVRTKGKQEFGMPTCV